MNGKNRRFATVVLSVLLYTQAGLCVTAASLVLLKQHVIAGPALAADLEARRVN